MANIILVNKGERRKLKELYKCSYPTVRTALNGSIKTALAFKIRQSALENGGVEVTTIKK